MVNLGALVFVISKTKTPLSFTKPIRKICMKSNNDSSDTLKFIITVKFDQKLGGKNRTEDNLTD